MIGCPSMYLYGAELPVCESKELTSDSLAALNRRVKLSQEEHDMICRYLQASGSLCLFHRILKICVFYMLEDRSAALVFQ